MHVQIYFLFLLIVLITANEITPTAKAETIDNSNVLLIDIQVLSSSLIHCNMHCVANVECEAFTLQAAGDPISMSDPSNVCKLQRRKLSSDSSNNLSIFNPTDITMVLKRGPIFVSTLLFIQDAETATTIFDTTTAENITSSTENTTSSTKNQTATTISDPTTTEATTSSTENQTATTISDPTTAETTTSSAENQTSATTISAAETTTLRTEIATLTSTATPPQPLTMPKYSNYICSALEQLDNDNYIFFWSTTAYLTKPMFTVVRKDDINGTRLQEAAIPDVFSNFEGSMVTSIFTIDNITYVNNGEKWMKYQIQLNSDGLIISADKLDGGISNQLLTASVYSSTAVGNDSVLWRQMDSKIFCFHASLIDSNQIDNPTPSTLCQQLADYMLRHVNATSVLGDSFETVKYLYNNKLYPYLPN